MENRNVKSAAMGLVAGAGTWVGGTAITRAFSSNECMNRPMGSCWKSNNTFSGLFEFLGNAGVTPLMVVVTFVALIFMALLLLAFNTGEQSRLGTPFAKAYVLSFLASMVINNLLV